MPVNGAKDLNTLSFLSVPAVLGAHLDPIGYDSYFII